MSSIAINKSKLTDIMYNNITTLNNQTESKEKNSSKPTIDNAVKDAYWHVLINCPEDTTNYSKEKQKVIFAIYKYYLKQERFTKERRQVINNTLNDLCFIQYGLPFNSLKAEQIYEILFSILYDHITPCEMMEFFRHSCKTYPTHYCIGCRKYSAFDCNK
jgi:hypothetical protein